MRDGPQNEVIGFRTDRTNVDSVPDASRVEFFANNFTHLGAP